MKNFITAIIILSVLFNVIFMVPSLITSIIKKISKKSYIKPSVTKKVKNAHPKSHMITSDIKMVKNFSPKIYIILKYIMKFLLFFIFPFAPIKYIKFVPKKYRILLIVSIFFLLPAIIFSIDNPTEESNTCSTCSTNKNIDKNKIKEIDEKIFDLAIRTGNINENFRKYILAFSQSKITSYKLYKAAKDTILDLKLVRNDYYVYGCGDDKDASSYVTATLSYIRKSESLAKNIIKYLDTNELKYLHETDCIFDDLISSIARVVTRRKEYLSSQGFSSEEISEIFTIKPKS